jgi:mRNA interferase MazF
VVRGDVHAITFPRKRGHVQHGRRYAVIVQSDDLLTLSTIAVCPTSSSAPAASIQPEIALGGESTQILCDMIGVVDTRALGEQVGHLTADEIRTVDDALMMVLDLSG